MNASNHVDELIEMYALGALTTEEYGSVKDHLATCARCRTLAAEASTITAQLAYAADDLTPAPVAKARLMARVDADLAVTPSVPAFAAPRPRALPEPRHSRWASLRHALGAWSPGFALACLVLLVITGAYALSLRDQMQQTQAKLAILSDPNLQSQALATTAATPPGAQARLLLTPDRSLALLNLNGMKPLDAAHTYQFWLIQDGKPLPAGTFQSDSSGSAQLLVRASQPLRDFQQAGVTIEPAGGSQTPTVSAMVFAGQLHQ